MASSDSDDAASKSQRATMKSHAATLSRDRVARASKSRDKIAGVTWHLDPLLSLYGIIYVRWYTRLLPSYRSQIPVAFGIPDHVTYQTPTRHALLGSGSC